MGQGHLVGGAAEEVAMVDMVSNSLMEADGLTAAAAEAMAAAVAEETAVAAPCRVVGGEAVEAMVAVAADVAAMAAEDRLLNLTLIKHLS